jgi:hypothetical protein
MFSVKNYVIDDAKQTQMRMLIAVQSHAYFSVQPSSWLLRVDSCSLSSTRGCTQVTLNI